MLSGWRRSSDFVRAGSPRGYGTPGCGTYRRLWVGLRQKHGNLFVLPLTEGFDVPVCFADAVILLELGRLVDRELWDVELSDDFGQC
jgi:hypothetical protein